MYNAAALSTFTLLYNPHHRPTAEFRHPESKLRPHQTIKSSPAPSTVTSVLSCWVYELDDSSCVRGTRVGPCESMPEFWFFSGLDNIALHGRTAFGLLPACFRHPLSVWLYSRHFCRVRRLVTGTQRFHSCGMTRRFLNDLANNGGCLVRGRRHFARMGLGRLGRDLTDRVFCTPIDSLL